MRTVTLPHITIPNVPTPSMNSIPHVNTATDQLGHTQYAKSERSRSPSGASTSSQSGEWENTAQNPENAMSAPLLDLDATTPEREKQSVQ